jgi:signal transduction histidine kinase
VSGGRRAWRSRCNVDLAYEAGRRPTRLPADVEITIYRLVQESLTNVVRHAWAGRARVSVTETDEEVTLAVSDDGRGFDSREPTNGFGMSGMRERAVLVRGRIEVQSGDEGTIVRAWMPTPMELRQTA